MDKHSLFSVIIKLDQKVITPCVKSVKELDNWEMRKLIISLKEAAEIEHTKKTAVSDGALDFIDDWLNVLLNKFEKSDADVLNVIVEIFRFLRNCTCNLLTQQYILEKTNILQNADFLYQKFIEIDIKHIGLKVLTQFLINSISSNKNAGEEIFRIFYKKLRKCLKENINTYENSALIYYISLMKIIVHVDLVNVVLELFDKNLENEFIIFFLENSICLSNFWDIYEDITIENKIILLQFLRNLHLKKQSNKLPLTSLKVLTENFLKTTPKIFDEKNNYLYVSEISLLLEIISFLSSDESYLPHFQNNDILINTSTLLINIHKLGKESNNCFTPMQKLSEFGNSSLSEHPAFGFKADLIRLIGNLCWKNSKMQDLARSAELIPVILDCCNMDARNPFIIQWSVLAVRNLCENNVHNQKIIVMLHEKGTVSSELLNEMGITLHSEREGHIKIVPLIP